MPDKPQPWGAADSYKGFDPKSKQDQDAYGSAYKNEGLLNRVKNFFTGETSQAATREALLQRAKSGKK